MKTLKTSRRGRIAQLLAGIAALTVAALPCSVCALATGAIYDEAPDASTLPEGTLIYSEDFDDYSSSDTDEVLELLGWEKAEGLRTFTMNLELRDGKLYIDNLADTSEDSYALMMDSDYLSKVCDQDYTYEYDVTYLDAGNTSRYVSLLCNYDGKDNYNTVDMRIRGDGYNQVRKGDSWIHYNNTTCPLRSFGDDAIVTQIFGEKFDENGYLLKGKTITVRVETSIDDGPTVYVNGINASEMEANTDQWNTIDSYAICFKASKLIEAEVDNLRIWTGLTDEPLEPVVETPADETASDSGTTAPQTGDEVYAAAALALASAAVIFAVRKNRA